MKGPIGTSTRRIQINLDLSSAEGNVPRYPFSKISIKAADDSLIHSNNERQAISKHLLSRISKITEDSKTLRKSQDFPKEKPPGFSPEKRSRNPRVRELSRAYKLDKFQYQQELSMYTLEDL